VLLDRLTDDAEVSPPLFGGIGFPLDALWLEGVPAPGAILTGAQRSFNTSGTAHDSLRNRQGCDDRVL